MTTVFEVVPRGERISNDVLPQKNAWHLFDFWRRILRWKRCMAAYVDGQEF